MERMVGDFSPPLAGFLEDRDLAVEGSDGDETAELGVSPGDSPDRGFISELATKYALKSLALTKWLPCRMNICTKPSESATARELPLGEYWKSV